MHTFAKQMFRFARNAQNASVCLQTVDSEAKAFCFNVQIYEKPKMKEKIMSAETLATVHTHTHTHTQVA